MERIYLFLNYLNYRRNEDKAKYSFLNYRWFDIAINTSRRNSFMCDNKKFTVDKHYEQKKIIFARTHRPCRRPRPLCCRLLSWTAQWGERCWRGRREAARWARWCCGTGGGAARAAPRTASPGTASASCMHTKAVRHEQVILDAGWLQLDFAESDKCKPVLLRLSLAGNLDHLCPSMGPNGGSVDMDSAHSF